MDLATLLGGGKKAGGAGARASSEPDLMSLLGGRTSGNAPAAGGAGPGAAGSAASEPADLLSLLGGKAVVVRERV